MPKVSGLVGENVVGCVQVGYLRQEISTFTGQILEDAHPIRHLEQLLLRVHAEDGDRTLELVAHGINGLQRHGHALRVAIDQCRHRNPRALQPIRQQRWCICRVVVLDAVVTQLLSDGLVDVGGTCDPTPGPCRAQGRSQPFDCAPPVGQDVVIRNHAATHGPCVDFGVEDMP